MEPLEVVEPPRPLVRGAVEQRDHLVHDGVHPVPHADRPAARQFLHVLGHREPHPEPVMPLEGGVGPGEVHRVGVAEDDPQEGLSPVFEAPEPERLDRSGGRSGQQHGGGERKDGASDHGAGVCQRERRSSAALERGIKQRR